MATANLQWLAWDDPMIFVQMFQKTMVDSLKKAHHMKFMGTMAGRVFFFKLDGMNRIQAFFQLE